MRVSVSHTTDHAQAPSQNSRHLPAALPRCTTLSDSVTWSRAVSSCTNEELFRDDLWHTRAPPKCYCIRQNGGGGHCLHASLRLYALWVCRAVR